MSQHRPAITAMTMAVSGGLCGLAGGVQMTSTMKYLVSGVQATIGIDAITVALLGRNKPVGTILAGLIFGAFKAGGSVMQIQVKVPVDMVLILQSVIVLLVAAPPFVRWLFRLPSPDGNARKYVTLQADKPAESGKADEAGKAEVADGSEGGDAVPAAAGVGADVGASPPGEPALPEETTGGKEES